MTSLVVPVVVWGREAPSHPVSALLLTSDCSHLVSASRDGHIILWNISIDHVYLEPVCVLLGHTGAVNALCEASVGSFVSASDNGDLCLWDLEDGRCIEATRLPGQHMGLQKLPTQESGVRILAFGYYQDIYVIDGSSLVHLYTLSSKTSPDWISALTVAKPIKKAEDVVIALTLSGHVKVWALNNVESKEMDAITEEQSKSLQCVNATYMACCGEDQKLLLVVSETGWHLYDVDDFVTLCRWEALALGQNQGEPAGPGSGPGVGFGFQQWVQGHFLSVDRVVVWTKQGVCQVFQLPIEVNPKHALYRSKLDVLPEATVIAKFSLVDQSAGSNVFLPEVKTTMRRSMSGDVFASGTEDGVLHIHLLAPPPAHSSQPKAAPLPAAPMKIPVLMRSCLAEVWKEMQPSGIIDHLIDEDGRCRSVTSSLYLSQYGTLACGRDDGTIVLIPAIEHAALKLLAPHYVTQLGLPSYFVMRGGHSGRVNCLLYPHQQAERYDKSYFVSGGIDFAIVLWNLLTGQMLKRFVPHAGQVQRLFIPPETCGVRIRQSVVSVSSDHSVCITSLNEKRSLLMASCHLFPVKTVKWRPSHDFMLVQTTDNTLYVWQLDTAHLDRVIQGQEAEDILSGCDEAEHEVTIRGNLRDAFKRRNVDALRDIALQQINELTQEKGAGGGGGGNSSSSYRTTNFSGLNICPIRLNSRDPFFHVLFFDTEALVIELLACDKRRTNSLGAAVNLQGASAKYQIDYQKLEKVRMLTQSGPNLSEKFSKFGNKLLENVKKEISTSAPTSPKQGMAGAAAGGGLGGSRRSSAQHSTNSDPQDFPDSEEAVEAWSGVSAEEEEAEAQQEQLTCEIAQLMMSVLYGWELDPALDHTCLHQLGLFSPSRSISFGINSRPGFMTLTLPNRHSLSEHHWQISGTITTQHRLAITALANTLMGMSVPVLAQKQLQKFSQASYAEMLQGWSSVAAMHCVLFPELCSVHLGYKPPDLEQLARKWQDRCLEVREAAQALFLAELRHIGASGRQQLVEKWANHLPLIAQENSGANAAGSQSAVIASNAAPGMTEASKENISAALTNHEEEEDDLLGGSGMSSGSNGSSSQFAALLSKQEAQRRQGTAIVMLGVIGAEFGQDITGASTLGQTIAPLEGFSGNNSSLARFTCQALTYLLLHPPLGAGDGSGGRQHAEIRRAAIHLIGRGFPVWEPYMDVSRVLLGLLELAADSHIHSENIMSGLPLNPASDSFHTAMYALTQIATTRPRVFITCIAREIARFSALTATAPSPGAVANIPSAVLARSKTEILRLVEILMEKQQAEVEALLLETMDIVVHCLDPSFLKNQSLKTIFPLCEKFLAVDHCQQTRRIAAGGQRCTIHVYDSRMLRPQTIQGNDPAPISCLCFGPDGKLFAAYAALSAKMYLWQANSSLFNMLAATSYKCVKIIPVSIGDPTVGLPAIRGRHFVSARRVIIRLADGTEKRVDF